MPLSDMGATLSSEGCRRSKFTTKPNWFVVIGRKAKHVSQDEAMSCVFGYTIGNDVTARSWQKSDRTHWRAKNTDTFKPMGAMDRDPMSTWTR